MGDYYGHRQTDLSLMTAESLAIHSWLEVLSWIMAPENVKSVCTIGWWPPCLIRMTWISVTTAKTGYGISSACTDIAKRERNTDASQVV